MAIDINSPIFINAPVTSTVSHELTATASSALKKDSGADETKDDTLRVKANEKSREELDVLAAELTDAISPMRTGLAFKVDELSGQPIVSVMDIDSGDVIRQIPNEDALELAKNLAEVAGFLLKTEA